ncbi:hypothetical protein BJX62DRAFT_137374 [Aspergillus germanicus]
MVPRNLTGSLAEDSLGVHNSVHKVGAESGGTGTDSVSAASLSRQMCTEHTQRTRMLCHSSISLSLPILREGSGRHTRRQQQMAALDASRVWPTPGRPGNPKRSATLEARWGARARVGLQSPFSMAASESIVTDPNPTVWTQDR